MASPDLTTRKWKAISKDIKMNENVIRKNADKVYWPYIIKYQGNSLSTSFLIEFIDKITENDLWSDVSKYCALDESFMTTYKNELDWANVFLFQEVVDRYIPDDFVKIDSIVVGGSETTITILKNDFFTNNDLTTLTTFTIYGNDIVGNNKQYTTINNIIETRDDYQFIIPNADYTAGHTVEGIFNADGTGSGQSTTTFLDTMISNSETFLYKDGDLTKNFIDEIVIGQVLSETFLETHEAKLDHTLISKHQKLTELFILRHDINTTFTGASSTLLTFDWDQLVINQTLKYVLESPHYSWTENLINYFLYLKYQNPTSTFINANLSKFQLSLLGRWNKNLTDAELETIQNSNPQLIDSAERSVNNKFNYLIEDIKQDLEDGGFAVNGDHTIGYVKTRRNGSLLFNHNLNFNLDENKIVQKLQVDLEQTNETNRIGIPIINENAIINDDEKSAYRYVKVKIPIIPRNTNNASTGQLEYGSKSFYTDKDKMYIDDGVSDISFEIDKTGDNAQTNSTFFNFFTFASVTDDKITTSSVHYFNDGDAIRFIGGGLPAELSTGTTYYVIVIDDTNIKVATSIDNALNNVVLNLSAGAGDVIRWDNRLYLTDDINIYNTEKIQLTTTTTLPAGLSTSTDYYIIKHNPNLVSLTTSKYNAENKLSIISVTDKGTGTHTLTTQGLPINVNNDDINTGSEMADIFDRLISDVQLISVADSSAFVADPYYPTIQDGTNTTTITTNHTTFTANADNNRITLASDINLNNGDAVTFTTTGTLPIYEKTIGTPVFTGTGLDDMSANGTYTGSASANFEVEIDGTGTPDTFRWRKDAGSWTNTVPITGNLQLLQDGFYIEFNATTGHTVTDKWDTATTVSTLSTGITTDPNTTYYVKKLSNTEYELASSKSNAENNITFDLSDSGSGTHTINSCKAILNSDTTLYNGNKVTLTTTGTLPTGLATATTYYVIKDNNNEIKFASTLSNALNNIFINIQNSGASGDHTIILNDINFVSSGASGVVRYIDSVNDNLYVEVVSGTFSNTDAVQNATSYSSPDTNINDDPANLLSLSSSITTNIQDLTSTLSSSDYSDANNNIQLYTNNINAIKSTGLQNGYNDTIKDQLALGIGCVIPDIQEIRCYSVVIQDNDAFSDIKF